MKKIGFILSIAILVSACNEPEDVFLENFEEGALITFQTVPEGDALRISVLNTSEYVFSQIVLDPRNTVLRYSLRLIYGDIVVNDFVVLTSFPNTLEFTGEDILTALNLTAEEIDTGIPLLLIATLTTANNTFDAALTDFNSDTNTQEGGDSSGDLFLNDNPNFNQAVNFSLAFFVPPPKKLRGTSFEEPFGAPLGSDYTRPDNEASLTAELLNNPGERHVMHTAVGDGVDDEIGFRTFFIDTGESGFTSEEIGVSNDPGEIGGVFLDGNQAYQMEDTDGIVRLEFDRVEVDATENPLSGIQIQYFPVDDNNNREVEDTFLVTVDVEYADGSTEILELLNITGLEINPNIGRWNLVTSGFLENITAYTMAVELNVNGGSEDMYFDQMLVFIPDN